MILPDIDVHSLPDLEAAALFGNLPALAGDDTLIAIMVYIYDHLATQALL